MQMRYKVTIKASHSLTFLVRDGVLHGCGGRGGEKQQQKVKEQQEQGVGGYHHPRCHPPAECSCHHVAAGLGLGFGVTSFVVTSFFVVFCGSRVNSRFLYLIFIVL